MNNLNSKAKIGVSGELTLAKFVMLIENINIERRVFSVVDTIPPRPSRLTLKGDTSIDVLCLRLVGLAARNAGIPRCDIIVA